MTVDDLQGTEKLLEQLRAVTGWTEETLQLHMSSWQADRLHLLEKIQGERIYLNELGDLVWESFPEGRHLDSISLFPESMTARVGPRAITLLNSDGKQNARLALPADCRPGLILTQEQVLIHAKELETQPFLAASTNWIDVAPQDFRTQHVDFHVNLETGMLFACCRELGDVVIFSLRDHVEIARWHVRKPGSWHALNLAFDGDGVRAYLTDNVSPQLWIADLETLELKVWKSGLGILGNLAPGQESGKIFLSILAPQYSLIYFDLATMQATYSLEIKGKSWAHAKLLPWDPMIVSPDGHLLHLVTWAELEGQRTPVVNVINAEEIIALRRFTLKETQQTVHLGYAAENPFLAWHALDFKSWLIEQKHMTMEQLEKPLIVQTESAPTRKAVTRGKFNIYQPPAEDQDLWGKIDKPGDELDLPVAAEDAIVDLLNWAFYRMTLTNLRIHPEELKRLNSLAKTLRKDLKEKEVVLAKLDNVLDKHSFETPISRQTVLSLLNQAKLGEGMVRLEDLCPICQQPFENGECPACGFRLDWPTGIGHLPGKVSAEPSTALYPGQILLPLRKQNILLTLNIWRQPLQQMDLAAAGVQHIAHCVVLPSLNYLVADSKANKVLEISPAGETLWKAKLALKHPVQVSWHQAEKDLRYLIVDQGNARILELDQSGRNWRRYPAIKTLEADKLKSPCDVQLTPTGSWLISDPGLKAVIEVDTRSQILHRWGHEVGVSSPLLARRMPEGTTEILDAASCCWLELLADGSPGRKMNYWPPVGTQWQQAAPPDWACQLHNGEYLLVGEDYMILFGPRHQSLRWIHALPDPRREDDLLKVSFRSRSTEEARKQQLADLTVALQVIGCLEGEKTEHLEYLARLVQPTKANAGSWLIRPGETGNHLYFVLEGVLAVIAPEVEEPVIYEAVAGDTCAQYAVFGQDEQAYKPGLKVKTDCRLLMLERADFKKAIVGFPRLYQIIRAQETDLARRFRLFAERKTEAVQDQLRHSINETRIREFGLFSGADSAFFDVLADKVQPLAYMPEQDVFGRLESAGSLFLILQGQVGVMRKGEVEPLIVLGEGEIFGEMALYTHQPRSATIRTLDYCKFFEIEYRHVRALSARFPWFGLRLEEMAQQRQQNNLLSLQAFEEAAGLLRGDLPIAEVAPKGQRLGQKVFYQTSLHGDMLVGLNTLGEILWCWGKEAEKQLFQPTRVHVLADSLLVVDTGNDRILQIDHASRQIIRKWSGSLNQPRAAALTPEGLLLVADEGNQRLVVMDESGREVWTHGLPEEIMKPTWVEFTQEGHILFADAGMHRVYELQRDGVLLWKYGKWRNPGSSNDQLDSPTCVRRLMDGGTLILDAGNQRLVWIRPENEPLLIPLNTYQIQPDYCELLENGEILIGSSQDDVFIRINRRGDLIWRAHLDYHFSNPTIDIPSENQTNQGEQWILDINRIDELQTKMDESEMVLQEPFSDLGPDATELLLAWGENMEKDTQLVIVGEEAKEQNPNLLTRELDALLGDLHDVIVAENAASNEPSVPESHWTDLVFSQPEQTLPQQTLNLPAELNTSHALIQSDQEVFDELEAAMGVLFGDDEMTMPSEAIVHSVDETVLKEDSHIQIPNHGQESLESSVLPESQPEDEELAFALDQLFDDEEMFDENGTVESVGGTHADELVSALDQLFDEPTETIVDVTNRESSSVVAKPELRDDDMEWLSDMQETLAEKSVDQHQDLSNSEWPAAILQPEPSQLALQNSLPLPVVEKPMQSSSEADQWDLGI